MIDEHLTDADLARLSGPEAPVPLPGDHLATCPGCRATLTLWQTLRGALREEAERNSPAPPPFETFVGPALGRLQQVRDEENPGTLPEAPDASPDVPEAPVGRRPRTVYAPITSLPGRSTPAGDGVVAGRAPIGAAGPVPPSAPKPAPAVPVRGAWHTVWNLVARQAVLMPRSWAPLTAAAFVLAALFAASRAEDRFGGPRLFSAVVALLIMVGALTAASPRRDPRRELLFTLPVPPVAVFLARLTVVFGVDVALATACSAFVEGPPGWWPVVSGWLGESLLAASCALALSVRFSPTAGAAAGGAVWLLGVLGGPETTLGAPFGALLAPLLSTTPWTFALAAVLLGWAVATMRRHLDHNSSPRP
ncbi:hypothetical protein [Streptomyces sp. CA-253872]|uniref:anti-sigma factor family protein n=1 Tax=Streptomyces sp. CA-253872 TaxID=3240067 RepID=UPI003D919113